LSFVQAGEPHVIVRTINGDVILRGLVKGGHQFFEVIPAALFALDALFIDSTRPVETKSI
jgi:hypothetical protein